MSKYGHRVLVLDTWNECGCKGSSCRAVYLYCELWSKLAAFALGKKPSQETLVKEADIGTAVPGRDQPNQNATEGQRPVHLLKLALQLL